MLIKEKNKSLLFFIFVISVFFITIDSVLSRNPDEKFKYYQDKYKVNCVSEKITDNFGNGYDSLYGTRNMRTILFGVAYRGGANNYYHKTNKRDNKNPLPQDGLKNLCAQGFSSAVYLYSTNFANAKKIYINGNDTLHYIQNAGLKRKKLKEIMLLVKDVIDNDNMGPVYLHCWNGWHQSGYVAATILMQFCNYTNEQAYQYWLDNTDGVTKGYDHIKKLIKEFKPFDDISIPDDIRKKICPCIKH
jgi:hypothetical protein